MALRTTRRPPAGASRPRTPSTTSRAPASRGDGRGPQTPQSNSHQRAPAGPSALPTDFSARIARNTQLYIQDETSVCKVIDPWGGSYYVEALTDELIRRAWAHIQEVESLGGMSKAIETGLPKMRIEEAAARRQARIDSGSEKIIGVNALQLEQEDPIDILEVDNSAVRDAQIARLAKLRANRNQEDVKKWLTAITNSVETGEGNLLELAVEAARARASLGEISDAVEKAAGRHKAVIRSISGIYSSEFAEEEIIEEVRKMTDEFEEREPPSAHHGRENGTGQADRG
ncbi:MAG: methylmalonyl-CoA mutase family protein [Cloacibacillus evryensis]